ncbi:MAG TPA: hypothetical protein VKQ36_01515 [Ktedonobacterales bacterium]|nr:hypothetical protein [Ktedonobacterales bacterium]
MNYTTDGQLAQRPGDEGQEGLAGHRFWQALIIVRQVAALNQPDSPTWRHTAANYAARWLK